MSNIDSSLPREGIGGQPLRWREVWLKEDWWAIWLGLGIVLVAYLFFANGSSIAQKTVGNGGDHDGEPDRQQIRRTGVEIDYPSDGEGELSERAFLRPEAGPERRVEGGELAFLVDDAVEDGGMPTLS
jgi:hypothetical protein